MTVPRGIVWFCGKTQVKKTTHAVELAFQARASVGPILVVDSQGAWNFRTWPRAATREHLYERIYGHRVDCAITPHDVDDVERIFRTVRTCGKAVVLTDEAKFWISKRKLPPEISLAGRSWAHSGALFIFTTQRIGDIHPDFLAIDCEIRVYRTLPGPDTDRLKDEYGIKPEEVSALPVGSFMTIINGETQRGRNGCPVVTAG